MSETETGAGYSRSRDYTLFTGHRIGGFHQTITKDDILTEDRMVTYDYDANGNRVSKIEADNLAKRADMTRMIWDVKNRLRRVDLNDNPSLRFDYDDVGRRIRKTGDSREDAILYVWDELAVISEFSEAADGSQMDLASYAFGHMRLALIRPGMGEQWVSHDMMGSISELTGSTGNLIEAKTFTPFGEGETVYTSIDGGYNRFGFTGHEY